MINENGNGIETAIHLRCCDDVFLVYYKSMQIIRRRDAL